MADRKSLLPAPRLIIAAALAGALAGAIAVYVTGDRSGNNAGTAVTAVAEQDAACTAKAEKAETLAASATGEIAALMPADPPQSLTQLAFNAPDGAPMTVADHAGKALLINLWATWCAPCREEMPALNALQKEMGGDKFEVVAVNIDTGDDSKPKKFLAETGVDSLALYRDNTMGVFNELKRRGLALGLPVTLLIDDKGCLLAHMNGPADWASTEAKKLVEAARPG